MKVCSVIAAAGLSSRMHTWKPLLPIDGVPAVVRLLRTLSSVSQCILITGYRHTELEAACNGIANIQFVYNANFAQTQMFESVCLGFSALPPDCSRVLFTPADIPMVSVSTVERLTVCPKPLVFPYFHERRGHPIALDASLVPALLQYQGTNGLKGALASLPIKPFLLEVNDPFILMDMDTRADYHAILRQISEGETHDKTKI